MARRWLQFETEISWFVLASALDVALTFIVLHYSHSGFTQVTIIESNPVARWFIHHWGVVGMAGFKLTLVLIVVAISEFVGRQRPVVARGLLMGGTAVVGLVVVHSIRMLLAQRI